MENELPKNMIPIWNFFKTLEPETEICMTELTEKVRKSRQLLVKSIKEFEKRGMLHVDRSSKYGNSRRANRYTVIKGMKCE